MMKPVLDEKLPWEFRKGFGEGILHTAYVLAYDAEFLSPKTRLKLMNAVQNAKYPHPELVESRKGDNHE
jgi:hypothetical protein